VLGFVFLHAVPVLIAVAVLILILSFLE